MLISRESITSFCAYLYERECSEATASKYLRDIEQLGVFCGGSLEDKNTLIAFKQHLQDVGYAPSSVNSMLAAVNCFLVYIGHPEWKLRYLKVPRSTFCGREKEMTQSDYEHLVEAAKRQGDERLELLVQTICATGIRVSEVRAVTVESLKKGRAEIRNKGKIRVILLPKKLCEVLAHTAKSRRWGAGPFS